MNSYPEMINKVKAGGTLNEEDSKTINETMTLIEARNLFFEYADFYSPEYEFKNIKLKSLHDRSMVDISYMVKLKTDRNWHFGVSRMMMFLADKKIEILKGPAWK